METDPNKIQFRDTKDLKEFITDAVHGAIKDLGLQKPPMPEENKAVSTDEQKSKNPYKSFGDFLRHAVRKDVYEGSTTGGGYAVPDVYANEIWNLAGFSNPFYNHARVITANTNSFKIPVVDVDTMTGPTANFGGVSMQIVNDGTAATEGQPAFKQITATPFLFRGHTQVSNEWLRDTGSLGGEQMLMKMFSDAMGLVSFYYSTNGSGAGEPEGYINAGFKKNTAARATASSFEDTDAHMMIAGLHPNHDPARTFWCVSNAVGSKILAISDKNNYIVDPRVALKPGYIGAMYGFPVYINQHGPAANTTGDVALIDGSTCFIVRGAAPTIAASDQFAFTSGLITYRYEYREDQRFCQDAVTTWPNSTTTSGVVLLLTK